jgi:hypothetical protein
MNRISAMAFILFSVSLGQSGLTQSTSHTAPATTTKAQTKQDKQTAKAKATKDDSKAHSGKKTTTAQDAATAAAYRSGIPKQ